MALSAYTEEQDNSREMFENCQPKLSFFNDYYDYYFLAFLKNDMIEKKNVFSTGFSFIFYFFIFFPFL